MAEMTEEMHEYMVGYTHAISHALKVLIDTLPDLERSVFNERFESAKDTLGQTAYRTKIESPHAKRGFADASSLFL